MRYVLKAASGGLALGCASQRSSSRVPPARISGPSTMMDRRRTFLTSRIALPKASWPSSSRKSRAPKSPFRAGSARRASRHMTFTFRRWKLLFQRAGPERLRARADQRAIVLEPNNATYLAVAARLLMQRAALGWSYPAPTTIGQSVRNTSSAPSRMATAMRPCRGSAATLDPVSAGVRPRFRAGPTGGRHQSQQPRCSQFRRSCASTTAAALMKPSHIFFAPSGSVPTGWARTGILPASLMSSWCAAIMNRH